LKYIFYNIFQLLKANKMSSTNPFDEYMSSSSAKKYKTRITIPRIRYINKGIQRTVERISYNKIKTQLSETQQKLYELKKAHNTAIIQLSELERRTTTIRYENIIQLNIPYKDDCKYITYDPSVYSVSLVGAENAVPYINGKKTYFNEFAICNSYKSPNIHSYTANEKLQNTIYMTNYICAYGFTSFNINKEKLMKILGQYNNIKIITLQISDDCGFTTKERGLCPETTSLCISDKFIDALSLFIHNNNHCEIHISMEINSFILAHICTKIKLSRVSKIIIYFKDDAALWGEYSAIPSGVKMSQTDFTTAQIKILMSSIKKKYHDKIHIIRTTILS